jgi:hypothetical protein
MQPPSTDRLRLADYKSKELSGTTNPVADTQLLFRHASNQVPWGYEVLEGDVYVPSVGIGANDIDIRSGSESETFRILLFF